MHLLGWLRMRRLVVLLAILAPLLCSTSAQAHDPSAFGGLFRSRNLGGTWLNADSGLFLNAVLTVAVAPKDPNHLLMGTDVGLMSSRNGGRNWTPEAPGLIVGAVFAIAFAPNGQTVLCAAPGGVFRFQDSGWTAVAAPADAVPARAIAFTDRPEQIYLLGRERLFMSRDGGRHFSRINAQLPEAAQMTGFAVAKGAGDILLAVVDGQIMTSEDGGKQWQARAISPPSPSEDASVDTGILDTGVPGRLWAARRDRIYVSDDLGRGWRALPQKLPEADTNVRGIVADPAATTLVVSTHRGMYRSEDGGRSWGFMESRLPVHIEAGPLARDPTDSRTVYAVYSLMPYPEVWRAAVQGSNLLSRLDFVSIAGGIAFVLLIFIGGGLLAYLLIRLRSGRSTPYRPAQSRSAP